MYYVLFFALGFIFCLLGGALLGPIGVGIGAVMAFVLVLGLAVLLAYLGVG
jgi:hypothetical protein